MDPLQRMIRAEHILTRKLGRKPSNKELSDFIQLVRDGKETV